MTDRTPTTAPGGGATASDGGFNADDTAIARETAPIMIGGRVFHRRRQNWDVSRELRRLRRFQNRAINETVRLEGVLDDLPDTATADEVAAAEDALEKQTEVAEQSVYDIIALLMSAAGEDGATVDKPLTKASVDHIKKSLDVQEVARLSALLLGRDNVDVDPTRGSPDSSS